MIHIHMVNLKKTFIPQWSLRVQLPKCKSILAVKQHLCKPYIRDYQLATITYLQAISAYFRYTNKFIMAILELKNP